MPSLVNTKEAAPIVSCTIHFTTQYVQFKEYLKQFKQIRFLLLELYCSELDKDAIYYIECMRRRKVRVARSQ